MYKLCALAPGARNTRVAGWPDARHVFEPAATFCHCTLQSTFAKKNQVIGDEAVLFPLNVRAKAHRSGCCQLLGGQAGAVHRW